MSGLSADKLEIGVTMSVTSKRSAVIEQVVLANLRINGIPIYAAPLRQELKLQAGQELVLPDPVQITLYFHDLDSLSPLRQAIDQGTIGIDGTAIAAVQLTGIDKLLLRSSQIQVPIAFHEEVPFQVPGGSLARTAALAMLAAADSALQGAAGTVGDLRNWASQFRRDLGEQYGPHVLFAYATYALQDKQGNVTQMEWSGIALQIAGDRLVVTKEAVEPWKFDPEIAAGIHANRFSVRPGSFDLWIWLHGAPIVDAAGHLNSPSALEYGKKDMSVLRMPEDVTTSVLTLIKPASPAKAAVHVRDTPSDLALLRIAAPSGSMDPLKSADDASAGSWDSVAIFRFRTGTGSPGAQPDVILMPATRTGGRIQLAEQVDAAAYGSPIVAPGGVIGIVQDDSGGVSWDEAAKALQLDRSQASGSEPGIAHLSARMIPGAP